MIFDKKHDRHPSADEIAAYLEQKLTREELPRVEAHIAECKDCRKEALAVTRILATRTRRRWFFTGGSLAAAIVAAVWLLPEWTSNLNMRELAEEATVRASSDEGVSRLSVIAPTAGAVLGPRDRTFRWQSLGTDVLYRITLTDREGVEVWTADTEETEATVPAEVVLVGGLRYFWRVDASLPDGRSATTRTLDFQTIP